MHAIAHALACALMHALRMPTLQVYDWLRLSTTANQITDIKTLINIKSLLFPYHLYACLCVCPYACLAHALMHAISHALACPLMHVLHIPALQVYDWLRLPTTGKQITGV